MYAIDHLELFHVSLFRTQVYDNEKLKHRLVDAILNSTDELEIPEDWSTNKILTSFSGNNQVIEKNRDLLRGQYLDCIRDIFDKEVELDFNDMWYNVYRDGEYQEEHDHLGNPFHQSHFSFIHFLSYDNKIHRPPEFKDPLSQIRNLSFELESFGCGEIYAPKVREGDILMFPSYLLHSVPPGSATEYPRITISFNITLKRYGEMR